MKCQQEQHTSCYIRKIDLLLFNVLPLNPRWPGSCHLTHSGTKRRTSSLPPHNQPWLCCHHPDHECGIYLRIFQMHVAKCIYHIIYICVLSGTYVYIYIYVHIYYIYTYVGWYWSFNCCKSLTRVPCGISSLEMCRLPACGTCRAAEPRSSGAMSGKSLCICLKSGR